MLPSHVLDHIIQPSFHEPVNTDLRSEAIEERTKVCVMPGERGPEAERDISGVEVLAEGGESFVMAMFVHVSWVTCRHLLLRWLCAF